MVLRRARDPLADLDPTRISASRRPDAAGALDAARRYDAIVGRAPDGPVRDRLESLRADVHAAVREVFAAAERTDRRAATLGDLDPDEITRRLKEARRRLARAEEDGRDAPELREAAASLDRQLGSVHAVWDAVERAAQELHRVQLRLGEVVALAGALAADLPDLAVDRIGGVADELQALRLALAELS
jgi:hypothetical protein